MKLLKAVNGKKSSTATDTGRDECQSLSATEKVLKDKNVRENKTNKRTLCSVKQKYCTRQKTIRKMRGKVAKKKGENYGIVNKRKMKLNHRISGALQVFAAAVIITWSLVHIVFKSSSTSYLSTGYGVMNKRQKLNNEA